MSPMVRKVVIDFGRTFLDFVAVDAVAALAQAAGLFESETFDAASWRSLGVGLAIAAGSSFIRALQAQFTRLEPTAKP